MSQEQINKYNFDTIEDLEIYNNSEQIKTDTKSFNKFISELSWSESKVGYGKTNKLHLKTRRSYSAKEKLNFIINTSDSNDIIDDFLDIDKIILSDSKSNITWLDENTMRSWDVLKYEPGDFFDYHTDGKSEKNHVGTIILLPPKSIFNYSGGELILLCDDKEIIINSDDNDWFCVVFDINIKHKVNKVLNGSRIVFKSKIFKNSKNKKIWFDKNNHKIDGEVINKDIKKYFNENEQYIKNKNNELIKKIKMLKEEIDTNIEAIKTKTHPVVKRIEKYFNKHHKKDFVLVLKNQYNFLNPNCLENDDLIVLDQILKLYPKINFRIIDINYTINHDDAKTKTDPDKCDLYYPNNININLKSFMTKFDTNELCGESEIENKYNDEYYYDVTHGHSTGIIFSFVDYKNTNVKMNLENSENSEDSKNSDN